MWMPIDFPGPVWLDWILTMSTPLGALTVIGVFLGKFWPRLRAFVDTTSALNELPKFVEDSITWRAKVEADIAAIKKEVLPNGGLSLNDRAVRNESVIGELLVGQKHIKRQLASVKTTQARTITQVEVLNATFGEHLDLSDSILGELRTSGLLPVQPNKGAK